ncbi:MAG: TIGR03619 family F420-dependent LLM class oxidoreductase [Georgfuchsia sp.]
MRFGFHMLMIDPAEYLAIARACDKWGWDSLYLPDAPFYPEKVSAPYPYSRDGSRWWPLDFPVLDPWIAITHMATVTERLRFIPSVLRMSVRKPLLEAKMACSVAAISNDRLAIGVGLAWMPEEFKFLHEDKKTRGARVNEAIQILRLCMGGGFVEFHGKHYDFDRLIMEPHPKKRIPIYGGGSTEPALLRAARYCDGWLGIHHAENEIREIVGKLNKERREAGRDKEPFDIILQCPQAVTVDDIRRIEDLGVTELWVTPWLALGYAEKLGKDANKTYWPQIPLEDKLRAIKQYGEEFIAKFR